MTEGSTQAFAATGTYSDDSEQDITSSVTWSSSNTAVATIISGTGLATVVASSGSTTITATLGSISETTTLTASEAVLKSIAVTPSNSSLAKGSTQQFAATGTYTDNSTQDVTTQVTWTSSNTSKATIESATGLATAVADSGSTTVTATLGSGVSGTTTLTTIAATLQSIAVTPGTPSIANGSKQAFVATGTYSDNSTQNITNSVIWHSSDVGVATISDSANPEVATTLAVGTTNITATLSGITSPQATLTATAAVLKSIAITPANPSVANGSKQPFVAIGTYSDNSTQNITSSVTWSSSNTAVATISDPANLGEATTLAVGTTNITATLSGVTSQQSTLSVVAVTLQSIAVTPTSLSLPIGNKQPFIAIGTYSNNSTQNITGSVVWNSSNPAVATIDDPANPGIATTLTAGSTNITATLSGITSQQSTLTVTTAALRAIVITPTNSSIEVGRTQKFVATGLYSDGTEHDITNSVTWSSSNPAMATIDDSMKRGVATGISAGTTNITAALSRITSSSGVLTIIEAKGYPVLGTITLFGIVNKALAFSAKDFIDQFTDADGGNLVKVKVTSLPGNGILALPGKTVIANQEIVVGDLGNLTFTPIANWVGSTSFTWNGSDG